MHAATLMSSEQVRAAISRRSECGYQQRRALREGSTARKSNPDAMEIGKTGDKKGKGKGDEKERKDFKRQKKDKMSNTAEKKPRKRETIRKNVQSLGGRIVRRIVGTM